MQQVNVWRGADRPTMGCAMNLSEFQSGTKVPPGEYQSQGHLEAGEECRSPPRQLSVPLSPIILPACRCGKRLRWLQSPGNPKR